MYFCGGGGCLNKSRGDTVHVLGWEVYGNSVFSSQLCYEPKTALKKKNVYLKKKVYPEDKIKSIRMVSGFKISILHDETRRTSLQQNETSGFLYTTYKK